MSRRASTFRQQDVTRALRAVDAAGRQVERVEIERDKIVLVMAGEMPSAPVDDLDRELAEFEARNGQN